MNSIELTPQEQKLLRKAEKTTRWWGSWKWCWAFFLFPLYFIVSRIYFAHRISQGFEYVLCVRLNGQLHPLDLSLLRAWDFITICIGIFMLCAVIPIFMLLRERRMFYDLVSKFREGSSQP
jgi:hypothetical protein